jgi:hypothetical protein
LTAAVLSAQSGSGVDAFVEVLGVGSVVVGAVV